MLDNAYFVGGGSQQGGGQFPVNQRGQTEYSAGVSVSNIFDRWFLGRGSASILSDGVSVKWDGENNVTGYIQQKIESQNLFGRQVTASVLTESGLITFSTIVPVQQNQNAQSSALGSIALTVGNWNNEYVSLAILTTSIDPTTILAAKLELGPRSTLARLVDGEWVLNDPPPNFQQELAKCERYQKILSGIYCVVGWGIMTSSTQATVLISLPSGLRLTSPTATLLGTLYLCTTGHLGDSEVTFTGSISNASIISD